ncbi:Hypothetical predicted protein [Paramuricea clavata]|uniref:Uncharacterized protein n=1 Tax=Paramuricea clavata TaxID=317549 RepID=A0A7D9D7P8_PARCT|nr:Hypothetical predicted protein [Paramuricea clavata]
MELRDETDDTEEFFRLEERILALSEARDRTVMQRELEEGRQAQEDDISRFRKFAKWARKEMVGLTGVAVSTASLITALLIHGRGVIVGTAKATSKVAKALAHIAKKGAPIFVPVFNAIATALSWGAKGIVWLASHLWVMGIVSETMSGKSGVNFDLKKKSDSGGIVSEMMSGKTGVRSTEKNIFSTKGIVSETMSGKSGVNFILKKISATSGIVSDMEIPKRRRIANDLELDPFTDTTTETKKRKADLKTTFGTPTKRPTRDHQRYLKE